MIVKPVLGTHRKIAWRRWPAPTPRDVDACALSLQHEFIYLHTPNNEDDHVFRFLLLVLCQPDLDVTQPWPLEQLACSQENENRLLISRNPRVCRDMLIHHADFFRFTFVQHPLTRIMRAWETARDTTTTMQPFPSLRHWLGTPRDGLNATGVTPQVHFAVNEGEEQAVHFVARSEDYWQSWHYIQLRVDTLPRKRFDEVLAFYTRILNAQRKKAKDKVNDLHVFADDALDIFRTDYLKLEYNKMLEPKHILHY